MAYIRLLQKNIDIWALGKNAKDLSHEQAISQVYTNVFGYFPLTNLKVASIVDAISSCRQEKRNTCLFSVQRMMDAKFQNMLKNKYSPLLNCVTLIVRQFLHVTPSGFGATNKFPLDI